MMNNTNAEQYAKVMSCLQRNTVSPYQQTPTKKNNVLEKECKRISLRKFNEIQENRQLSEIRKTVLAMNRKFHKDIDVTFF